jgi:uncharacterized membrane protein YiaA
MKIWRFLIITGLLFILSLSLHLPVYGTKFNLETISNVTFVVGIITFLPALVALTGAYQVFHGMGYFFKILFNKNAKQEFPTYRDYKEDKSNNSDTSFYKELLIGSLIVLVVGIILAIIIMI